MFQLYSAICMIHIYMYLKLTEVINSVNSLTMKSTFISGLWNKIRKTNTENCHHKLWRTCLAINVSIFICFCRWYFISLLEFFKNLRKFLDWTSIDNCLCGKLRYLGHSLVSTYNYCKNRFENQLHNRGIYLHLSLVKTYDFVHVQNILRESYV